jgi:hypothetical protein
MPRSGRMAGMSGSPEVEVVDEEVLDGLLGVACHTPRSRVLRAAVSSHAWRCVHSPPLSHFYVASTLLPLTPPSRRKLRADPKVKPDSLRPYLLIRTPPSTPLLCSSPALALPSTRCRCRESPRTHTNHVTRTYIHTYPHTRSTAQFKERAHMSGGNAPWLRQPS